MSLGQVAHSFFKRRVSRQAEQVRKTYESMNAYYGHVEGGDLDELSLKNYWKGTCETKNDFLP